jgi:formate dehydrogenase iron-sulfur subunit
MQAAILTDLTRCIGCEACVWACKEINDLPREDGARALSATSWTIIDRIGDVPVRRQCMHCLEPSCVSVCPVGALSKRPEGPVVYDAAKCMGCRYCMIGCPFGMPKYEWNTAVPRVQKCILCWEKSLSHGGAPACTTACPTGATTFGDRDALLAEAHRRIAAEPARYVDRVYGEHEAGGTSVLYLSAVPFEQLGFPASLAGDPVPRLTWNVLSKLPNVVSVAGVTLFGIWWITNRRDEVAEAEKEDRP